MRLIRAILITLKIGFIDHLIFNRRGRRMWGFACCMSYIKSITKESINEIKNKRARK